jgi:hypothetical protein
VGLLEQALSAAEAAGLEGGRWAEQRGRLAEMLIEHDSSDARIGGLLESALAADQLTGDRREQKIRSRFEVLLDSWRRSEAAVSGD